MKKNKNNFLKFIFLIFLLFFLIIYFAEMMGYYEYQNNKQTTLTKEQIKKYEQDIKNGIAVDLNDYLIIDNTIYNNNLSKFTSKMSDGISNIVTSFINTIFKYISTFIDE